MPRARTPTTRPPRSSRARLHPARLTGTPRERATPVSEPVVDPGFPGRSEVVVHGLRGNVVGGRLPGHANRTMCRQRSRQALTSAEPTPRPRDEATTNRSFMTPIRPEEVVSQLQNRVANPTSWPPSAAMSCTPSWVGIRDQRARHRTGARSRRARRGRSRNSARISGSSRMQAGLGSDDANLNRHQLRGILDLLAICADPARRDLSLFGEPLRSLSFHSRNRNSTRDRQSCSGEFRGPSRKAGTPDDSSDRPGEPRSALWVVYAVMATLLAAYLVSLMVRSADDSWPWVDGWGVAAYEVILAALLLARGFTGLPGRAVPLVLGSCGPGLGARRRGAHRGGLGWRQHRDPVARRRLLRVLLPAGLRGDRAHAPQGDQAAAAGDVAGWSHRRAGRGGRLRRIRIPCRVQVPRRRRDPIGVAVDLIYPIGDVLLLALVVGGTAVLPGRRLPWLLFATACGGERHRRHVQPVRDDLAGRRCLQRNRLADRDHPDVHLGLGARRGVAICSRAASSRVRAPGMRARSPGS